MSAQDVIMGSRVTHLRELKTEVASLKADNAALRTELETLKAHFDMMLLAAEDLKSLPDGGRFLIWDGWNMILGAQKTAHSRTELIARAKRHLDGHPLDRVWIVLDGPKESVENVDRLRVSYTGGAGLHRADRQIVNYVRMAAYLGLADRIVVETCDKEIKTQVNRLRGRGTISSKNQI